MADKRIFQLDDEGFLDDITDKVYMWLDKKANEGEPDEPSWKFKANVFLKILNNMATKFVPNVLTVEGKCYWHDGELFVCNVAYTGDWVPGNFTATSIDALFARIADVTMKANLLGTASTDADMDSSHALTLVKNDGTQTKLPANLVAKASDVAALGTKTDNIAHSIAPEFNPTRTVNNPYKKNEAVTYTDGKMYVFTSEHYGAWTGNDVVPANSYNTVPADSRTYYNYPFSTFSSSVVPLKGFILGLYIPNRDSDANYLLRVVYKNKYNSTSGKYENQLTVAKYVGSTRTDYEFFRSSTSEKVDRNVEVLTDSSGIVIIVNWNAIADGTNIAVSNNSNYYFSDIVFQKDNNIFVKFIANLNYAIETTPVDCRGSYNYPFVNDNSFTKSVKGVILGLYIPNKDPDAHYLLGAIYKNKYNSESNKFEYVLTFSKYVGTTRTDYTLVSDSYAGRVYRGAEMWSHKASGIMVVVNWAAMQEGGESFLDDSTVYLDDIVFKKDNNIFLSLFDKLNVSDYRGSLFYPFSSPNIRNTDFSRFILGLYIPNRDSDANYLLRVVYKNKYNSTTGKYENQLTVAKYVGNTRTDYDLLAYTTSDEKRTAGVEILTLGSDGMVAIVDWRLLKDGSNYAVTDNTDYYLDSVVFERNNNIFLFLAEDDGNIQSHLQSHLDATNPHHITKEMIGVVPVTTSSNGLMTSEDKRKLDSITANINYSISGSGVAKNAAAFGFLPSATASENSAALKDALSTSGTVIIDIPGVYYVDESIPVKSNTKIIFGNGTYMYRANKTGGVGATHQFYNEHFRDPSIIDENIEIDGLNYDYTVNRESSDIAVPKGCRGMLMFNNVKNLVIRNLRVYNAINSGDFTVQVANFENLLISGCSIDSLKDGIHLGPGKNFVIENCEFHTNDDAIAMNAVDYAASNPSYGNIENGVIQNIHFLPAGTFNTGRGIYSLVGAWVNWHSGIEVQKYGGIVVSDGRIYVTEDTNGPTTDKAISTVQPTHSTGKVTGSDGITWRMKQDYNVGNSAVIKNITVRNVIFDRVSHQLFMIHMGGDSYINTLTEGANPPACDNILLDNLSANVSYGNFVNSCTVVRLLKIVNSRMSGNSQIVRVGLNDSSSSDESNVIMNCNNLEAASGAGTTLIQAVNGYSVKAKVAASMPTHDNVTWSVSGDVSIDSDVGPSA